MKRNNMLRKLLLTVAIIALTILFQTLATNAAWGDFDTSFGFQGATVDPITGYFPLGTAIQPDGKILVTGYRITPSFGRKGFFLRRYLSDGQLDTAFGTGGAAIGPETNSFTTDYRADRIVILTNGKIAVSGWANGYYAVWQFNPNGTKDKTFGQNGLLDLTNYPVVSSTYPELNIQSGRLLLSLREQGNTTDLTVLVRLTSTGAIDGGFGNAGKSVTGIYGGKLYGTVVEPDGKITVGGVKLNDPSGKGLERKLANGQDDLSFSPPWAYAYGLTLPGLVRMANAKYAVRSGNLAGNGSVTYSLERISSAGVFEASITPYNGFLDYRCPEIFSNQNDGKVLVQLGGLLFRLNSDLTTVESNYCPNLNGITSFARAAIQSDDKMMVAGIYNNYLMLARLLPN